MNHWMQLHPWNEERWAANGFDASQEAFKTKNNDLPNAIIIKNNSLEANYYLCL